MGSVSDCAGHSLSPLARPRVRVCMVHSKRSPDSRCAQKGQELLIAHLEPPPGGGRLSQLPRLRPRVQLPVPLGLRLLLGAR